MPKRILIFSLAYYPRHVGGAEVAIKEITDRCSPAEYEFHLITNCFDTALSRTERIGNVTVHRVGFGRKGAGTAATHSKLFYIAKVLYVPAAALRAYRLHRVHAFHGAWAMMAYMTFPLVLLRMVGVRIPYAITLQEGDPFEHVFKRWYIRVFRPLLTYGFRHASVIQSISEYLAGWARELAPHVPVVVVPNGVNTALFGTPPSAPELSETLGATGKKEGEKWLIHTGRYVHKNGLDTIIRALPLLDTSVHLLLLGEGPLEQELRTLAQELQVADRVHFHPYVPLHETVPYLYACDMFIRPSRSEGMGISFVEAMAAGLPVIATQEGGISDFLFDARRNPDKPTTGWAVGVDAPDGIARAVRDIVGDKAQTTRVLAQARALVHERYEWDTIARDMREQVFTKLQ